MSNKLIGGSMDNIKIVFEDCVRVGSDLIMVDSRYNIIYKISIFDGKVSILGSLPEEKMLTPRLSSKIIYNKDCLYFSPMNAKKIWKYNLSTSEWKGFEKKDISHWCNYKFLFQAILYKDTIFFIGSHYPAIIAFDTLSEKMVYITKPYEYLKAASERVADNYFRCDYVQYGNEILMASCVSNEIMKFNLDTLESTFVKVGESDYRYSGIAFDGSVYYLSPRKYGPIVVWDGNKDWISYNLPSVYDDNNEMIFAGAICEGENVVFPSCFSDYSLVMDKNRRLQVYKERYYMYKQVDDMTKVYYSASGLLHIVYDGILREYKISLQRETFEKYLCDAISDKHEKIVGFMKEKDEFNVKTFIKCI